MLRAAVVLAVLALAAGASVFRQPHEEEQEAARLRLVRAEQFDQREKRMHPAAPFAVRDSADDHGSNYREPGPVEEQDPSYWLDQAKQKIESELLQRTEIRGVAKNVIIFMGDGMSIPTLAATRVYIKGEKEQLSFEKFPAVGLSKTYCVDTQVADSACSASAYLCGVKVNMGTMGVSAKVPRSNCTAQLDPATHVDSILAWGLRAGKRAGVVTTTRITHASPGGAYAHTANRDWEDDADKSADQDAVGADACKDIARQLVEDEPGNKLNVIMGGGRRAFVPKSAHKNGRRMDGADLRQAWKDSKKGQKFQYIETKDELDKVDPANTDYLMGLFEWSHVQYHLEADATQPRLVDMVQKAIAVLNRGEQGYVLFVEGGRIDHGHHDTYAHLALDETKEFSEAIQAAVDSTDQTETLIVVTSDHAHTMSLAGYAQRGNNIFRFAGNDGKQNYTTLSYSNGPGYKHPNADGSEHNPDEDPTEDLRYAFPSTVYLDSETHGGDDVGIFARGPWAHLYTGVLEQNLIPNIAAYAAAIGPFQGRAEDGSTSSPPASTTPSGAPAQPVALASMIASLLVPLAAKALLL